MNLSWIGLSITKYHIKGWIITLLGIALFLLGAGTLLHKMGMSYKDLLGFLGWIWPVAALIIGICLFICGMDALFPSFPSKIPSDTANHRNY